MLFTVWRFHQLVTPVSNSIFTFLVTWLSNSAVTFLIWLCLKVIKPPFLEEKICCTSYWASKIHWVDSFVNGQPYAYFTNIHRLLVVTSIATLKHPFPSVCRSILVFRQTKNRITFSFCVFCRKFPCLIFVFTSLLLPCLHYKLYFCSNWSFINDAVTALEFSYSFSAMLQKITIPIPPYFTGSDSSFLSISLQKWPSVRVGKISYLQLDPTFEDVCGYQERSWLCIWLNVKNHQQKHNTLLVVLLQPFYSKLQASIP